MRLPNLRNSEFIRRLQFWHENPIGSRPGLRWVFGRQSPYRDYFEMVTSPMFLTKQDIKRYEEIMAGPRPKRLATPLKIEPTDKQLKEKEAHAKYLAVRHIVEAARTRL